MAAHSLATRIATLGPLGRSPVAPGTVGTIVAGAPSAYLVSKLPWGPALGVLVGLFLMACFAASRAEEEFGRHDPGQVVIDELMGLLVTLIGLPLTVKSLVLGIVAFRLFDIWKPWPVSVLDQKVKGGLGIVLDDVGAGVLAHGLVWAALALWP